MGALIKSTAITKNGSNSSIELAVQAAEKCISKSNIAKEDIDLLINIGLYRDDNIMEPAIAPLIQKELGINLDPALNPDKTTFSFDLANGVCGFIYASKVIQASFATGRSRCALIVSSDVHPSKKNHPDFPYREVGAAMLLENTNDDRYGFKDFLIKSSSNGYYGLSSYCDITKTGTMGRSTFDFFKEQNYTEKLRNLVSGEVGGYLDSLNVSKSDINLVIASHHEKNFGKRVSDSIGINGKSRVIDLYDQYNNPGTSTFSLGYDYALSENMVNKDDRILFIGAGSGLTLACALYIAP